ncbi:glucosylglycerol 3-phosphatase [Prochlorococcus marinus]|uniref:Putative glucosylglycerolphosphate phosphatase n=1 Tax=Prochlorococcus marinus (strain MIT 9211) TaxID=93059 RepID=A9BA16_PROM4|nr:glucosylglycerol 3-phosphatase [Prochlorococcus marinus]ABX08678.1 putative glucosylglycerolphosphate phosphatase [Prochlorococcus marinus str. MIT 9211]
MLKRILNSLDLIKELTSQEDILIVQDIDGVCIPLVKDPMKRVIESKYVKAISSFSNEFAVLTCGEHEGPRGVNRIIERSIGSIEAVRKEGLYLPGLAACGVEYQDRYGNISLPGLEKGEIDFLNKIPHKMEELLIEELPSVMPWLTTSEISKQANRAICDTRFSPAINLNELFSLVPNKIEIQQNLQIMMEKVMNKVIFFAESKGLEGVFHLHISPNLGLKNGKEISKYATKDDIGTTDIQLIINGALKEAGLLFLINQYIKQKTGESPLGKDFNVREAPRSASKLVEKVFENIPAKEMPTIVGVGDTVTSIMNPKNKAWLRGGSDRGFLTLIKELGKKFNKENRVIFVDSSHGEVYRPSTKGGSLNGISDPDDLLKFDLVMEGGPMQYIEWIIKLSKIRNKF